ncbi:MAG: outer membrane beta-barrel protein [Pseudomonadota bacterium]|nr:outer membrane beta-barrel protein [Pseudomonadota bacterium]
MMRSSLIALSVVLGTLASTAVYAQSDSPPNLPTALQPFSQLIDSGQYQRAFEQGQGLLNEWSGEPIFDYLYGLAALNSGALEQARFAFERILIAQPNHHRARLELARLQMAQGLWIHARENFMLVLNHNPPETVSQNIYRMLSELSRREATQQTQQHFRLGLSSGFDSNVNSATSLHSINLEFAGLGTLTAILPNDVKAKESAFAKVQGDAVWLIPHTQQRHWLTSVQAEHKHLLEDWPFDQTQLSFGAGVKQRVGLNQFQLMAQSLSIWRDAKTLLWSPSVTGQWHRLLNRHVRVGLNSRWSGVHYMDQPKLNLDIYRIASQLQWQQGAHQWLLQPHFTANRLRHRERQHLDHNQWGVSANYQLQPLPNWAFGISGQWQQSDYRTPHPFFGKKRQEQYWHVAAEGQYQLTPTWQLWGELRHTDQNSNLPLFEYDRTLVELGVRYLWQ